MKTKTNAEDCQKEVQEKLPALGRIIISRSLPSSG